MERRKTSRTGDRKKPGFSKGSTGRSAGTGSRSGAARPAGRGYAGKSGGRSAGGEGAGKREGGSSFERKSSAGFKKKYTGAGSDRPERGAGWDKKSTGDKPVRREKREGESSGFKREKPGGFRRESKSEGARAKSTNWRDLKGANPEGFTKPERGGSGWSDKPERKTSDEKPWREKKEDAPAESRRTESRSSRVERPGADSGDKRPGWRDRKSSESGGEEKTERKTSGWGDKSFNDRKPSRSAGADKPDRKPYSSDAAPRRSSYGDKPREERSSYKGKTEGSTGRSSYGDKPREERSSYRGKTEGSPVRRTYSDRPVKDESAPTKWNRKEKHEFYGDKKKTFGRKAKAVDPLGADDGLTRLNKFIANAGICSRREADDMIKAGVIKVNGEIITTLGYKLKPEDEVRYNDAILRGEKNVYILLNKPKDYITTTDDPEDRKTVMNLIAGACKERVYPVGRLDRNTTGVLLFTNDGDLARKLTHPSFAVQKIYQVEVDPPLQTGDMDKIAKGIYLDDGFIQVDEIAYTGTDNSRSQVGVEIHSGKNRIVRRIFEHFGYKVSKLDRVIFAGLTKKDMPRGRWRFLSELEVANLKMLSGKKKTSGVVS